MSVVMASSPVPKVEATFPDAPVLRTPTTLDWEELRVLITERWEQRNTRKEIKDELAELGFAVTERMILTRIHNWKLDRNSKEFEIAASARKLLERQAAGKESVVLIRRRRMDEAKLRRYAKRKATTLEDLAKLARATTPEVVQVRTPSPSPVARSPSPRSVSAPDIYAVPEKLFKESEAYTASRVSVLNGILTGFVIGGTGDVDLLLAKVLINWMPGWDAAFIKALEDAQEFLLKWKRTGSKRDVMRAGKCMDQALKQFPSKMQQAGMGFLMRLTLIVNEYIVNGFHEAAAVILRALCNWSAELNHLRRYSSLFQSYLSAVNQNSFTLSAGSVITLICRTIEANTIEEYAPHSLQTTSETQLLPALSWRRVDDSTLIISIDSPNDPGKRVSGSVHSPLLISQARGTFGGRSFTGFSDPAAAEPLTVA